MKDKLRSGAWNMMSVHEEDGKAEQLADEQKPDNALEAYGAT
jgi:hypothetical protein